jgi:hypothetical protein
MLTKRHLLRSAALVATTAAASRVGRVLAQTSGDRPGFFKTKDIAEAGFIYGLPIVMNYAVMYAFSVDRSSGQFKVPFNQIANEHRLFTYEDTTVIAANSDTPYSGAFLDLRAEPIVVSVPRVDLKRYYVVQLTDGNTYNYGYMGAARRPARPATTWSSGRNGKDQHLRGSKTSFVRVRNSLC